MTVGELITQINLESNDILDNRSEYIPYVNAAIDYLSMVLVAMKDSEVVLSMTINDNDVIPTNFMRFVPQNGYPVKTESGVFKTYDGGNVSAYYAVRKNHISGDSDAVPFGEMYQAYLVQLVSFLVKKKSLMIDFASFDKTFIADLTQAIQASKGG